MTWPEDYINRTLTGDCRKWLPKLPDNSVQCVVTSPPYWGLRDYGVAGQIGLEKSLDAYMSEIDQVFRQIHRVLKPDGTLWVNLGDSRSGSWGNYGGHNRGHGRQRQITTGSSAPSAQGIYLPPTASMEGLKPKNLIGIPWRVAFMLQSFGWYLRSDIIWHKPSCMPESVKDRPTKAHEYLFLLSKSEKYYYDCDAIREPYAEATLIRSAQDIENQAGSDRAHAGGKTNGPMKAFPKSVAGWDSGPGSHSTIDHNKPSSHKGSKFDNGKTAVHQKGASEKPREDSAIGRNKRTVWDIPTQPTKGAHFATFPEKLVEPCILAGSRPGDIVLDPFHGSGTVGRVTERLGRRWIGIELKPEYVDLSNQRTAQTGMMI